MDDRLRAVEIAFGKVGSTPRNTGTRHSPRSRRRSVGPADEPRDGGCYACRKMPCGSPRSRAAGVMIVRSFTANAAAVLDGLANVVLANEVDGAVRFRRRRSSLPRRRALPGESAAGPPGSHRPWRTGWGRPWRIDSGTSGLRRRGTNPCSPRVGPGTCLSAGRGAGGRACPRRDARPPGRLVTGRKRRPAPRKTGRPDTPPRPGA